MKRTRDDIKVFRDENETLHIDIHFPNENVYRVTAKGDEATMPAIATLWEAVTHKELGINVNDIVTVVGDFFEAEKKDG